MSNCVKVCTTTSLGDASSHPGRIWAFDGNLYWSDGSTWINITNLFPRKEIPNTAFVDPKLPTLTEVETWVSANLNDEEKNYCDLFMIEQLQVMGYGLNNSENIPLSTGSDALYLISVTINGNVYPIDQYIEDISNTSNPILLDYAGCSSAITAIEAAFTTEGVDSSVEIYGAGSNAIITTYTKAVDSHTLLFTYTRDNSATTANTTLRTSVEKAYVIGSTIDSPDHVWQVVGNVVQSVYHRKYTGVHYYIKKSLSNTTAAYAQLGNPDRPFRSTTDAMLYAGISTMASNSVVIFLESGNQAVDHLNIIKNNSIVVSGNNISNNILVRYNTNNRSVSINDCLYSNIHFKCSDSISSASLNIRGSSMLGFSTCSFYSVFNENGTAGKVDINGLAINFVGSAFQDIVYNVNTGSFNGTLNVTLNDSSKFFLNSHSASNTSFKSYFETNGTSNLVINCGDIIGNITVQESSTLTLNATTLTSAFGLSLATDSNVHINSIVTNCEITVLKTTVSATRPVYHITTDVLKLNTANNLPISFIGANDIQDVIINYTFNTGHDLNLFKTTGASTGMSNVEVNYNFGTLTMSLWTILSWGGELSGCKFNITGNKITYTNSTSINLLYYQPSASSSPNQISINCDIYAQSVLASSTFAVRPVNAQDVFRVKGKIFAQNVTNLFTIDSTVSFGFYLEGETYNVDSLITSTNLAAFPKVFLKDLTYCFSNGDDEFVDSSGAGEIVVQNVATNIVLTTAVPFVGGTVVRDSSFDIIGNLID